MRAAGIVKTFDWSEIAPGPWPAVLIGNGLSRYFSKDFAYASLYREASKEVGTRHHLTDEDKALFKALDTTDFEGVLSGLTTARSILNALGQDDSFLVKRYESIKDALIQTLTAIHPDQGFRIGMLRRLCDALASFDYVYTTNYDLLIYWAVIQRPTGFNDYFRSATCEMEGDWVCFSRPGARALELACNVLYLHGALHLYETRWGQTVKYTYSPEHGRLLDRFRASAAHHDPVSPLFVSEGTSAQKVAAIGRSDYLSFVFDHFIERQGPLVVFGHSLGDSDSHIAEAIADWDPTRIAVSVRGGDHTATQARLQALFPKHEVVLYRAASHPLADLGFPFGRPLRGTWADRMDLPV